MKLEGSLVNRLYENQQFVEEIKVGMGATEYFYSDRHAYEVVEVKDQKHISIRRYDARLTDGAYSNNYKLISNEKNPIRNLVYRNNRWYEEFVIKFDNYKNIYEKYHNNQSYTEDEFCQAIWLANHNISLEQLKQKQIMKKYHKTNISIGIADEHYDWSF